MQTQLKLKRAKVSNESNRLGGCSGDLLDSRIPDRRMARMELNDPKAPWIPEGLAERLVVGARVRWRRNPECDWKCPTCGHSSHDNYPDTGEGTIFKFGKTPLVHHWQTGCGTTMPHQGHDYMIEPNDATVIDKNGERLGFWAAANELTPLEAL